MERQKVKPKEVPKEVKEKVDKELEDLRKELARLKELRRKKTIEKQESIQEAGTEEIFEEETIEKLPSEEIEARLDKIEDFLTSKLGEIDQKAYKQNAAQIEKELQEIELEIIREKGVVAREISTYELLLND